MSKFQLFFLLLISYQSNSNELEQLDIFSKDYPKSIYFRNAEGSAAREDVSYEKWKKRWSKLSGMVVKALDEEIPGRSGEAQRKFLKYKKEFPSKLMLLHFNGNARDPRFDVKGFEHDNWTYFVGGNNLSEIQANINSTIIYVENIEAYKVNLGKKRKFNDDIAIITREENGQLNWERVEQVKLVSVNKKNKSIKVKRGQFNTSPLSFKKGQAYLASHVAQPPFAPGTNQSLWRYNFANGTKSKNGTALNLAKNLLKYLNPNGRLATFDGVEFDVLTEFRGINHYSRKNRIDYHPDGVFNALDLKLQQEYKTGVYQFLLELRKRLGPNKFILADGNEYNQQRGFSILNGIESETWPSHWDRDVDNWSSGLNRHNYWKNNSFSPHFSYIKLGKVPSKSGGSVSTTENLRRLRIAGALFMDAIIAPAYRPKRLKIDNWPELTGKQRENNGWLGKPISPAQSIGLDGELQKSVSYLKEVKVNEGKSLFTKFSKVKIKGLNDNNTQFYIEFLLTKTSDIVIELDAYILPTDEELSFRGKRIEVHVKNNPKHKEMSWLGKDMSSSRFYFKELPEGKTTVYFHLEDNQIMNISRLNLFIGPEIVMREFENGIVIANPSKSEQKISLPKEIWKGVEFLQPVMRKNKLVDGRLNIPSKDAVFLKKK